MNNLIKDMVNFEFKLPSTKLGVPLVFGKILTLLDDDKVDSNEYENDVILDA